MARHALGVTLDKQSRRALALALATAAMSACGSDPSPADLDGATESDGEGETDDDAADQGGATVGGEDEGEGRDGTTSAQSGDATSDDTRASTSADTGPAQDDGTSSGDGTMGSLPDLPAPIVETISMGVVGFDLAQSGEGEMQVAFSVFGANSSELSLATWNDSWTTVPLGEGATPRLAINAADERQLLYRQAIGAPIAGRRLAYATDANEWAVVQVDAATEPHATVDMDIAVDANDVVHLLFMAPAEEGNPRDVLWHAEQVGAGFVLEVVDDAGLSGSDAGRSPRLVSATDGSLHAAYAVWDGSDLELTHAHGTTGAWEIASVPTTAFPQVFDLALDSGDSPHLVVSAGNQAEPAGLWILAGSNYDESVVDATSDLWAVALHVDAEGAPHVAAVSSAGIAQSADVTYYRPGADEFERYELHSQPGNGGAVDITVDDERFPLVVTLGGGGGLSLIRY